MSETTANDVRLCDLPVEIGYHGQGIAHCAEGNLRNLHSVF